MLSRIAVLEIHYIYGLKDPRTDEYHYVGRSKSVKVRLTRHNGNKNASINSSKNTWLRSLNKARIKPEVVILQEVDSESVKDAEIDWIRKLYHEGHPLTNKLLYFPNLDKPKRPFGRPKGTTQYETAKSDESHHMTPKAHAFIKANKKLIENMAREHHEVQWKMF